MNSRQLPAACCLLPSPTESPPTTAHCLLPAACCLLPAALLAIAATSTQAQIRQATPVDGDPFQAELSAIDAQWQVTFRSGDNRRVLPAVELVRWGRWIEAKQGPLVLLADGGLLIADVLEADKEKLFADADLFGSVTLPLELVAGVIFLLPTDQHASDLLLDRVSSGSGKSDRVILTNGDEIAGRFEAIHDDTVSLETDVGAIAIQIDRVRALVFNPSVVRQVQRQRLHAVAGFADGSRLIADQLVVEGKSLEITVAGSRVPSGCWTTTPDKLVCLLPLGGGVTYLSDLKPAGYRHLPFLELPWTYRTDRNVTGGLLRSGGRLHLKGLGMHSAARLTYLLAGPYRRFQAELAIDDHTAGRGSVRFRVFVDGSQKYASPIVRGGSAPLPVSVDIPGPKRLDLIVDYADRADELDHANWLDARLVR